MNTKTLKLSDVQDQISSGDLLQFRRRSLISIGGRGVHSHSAMAIRFIDGTSELFLAEMVCGGGRLVTLESQIEQNPGQYEWYQADKEHFPDYDNVGAARYMARLATGKYGWWSLIKASWLHLPFIRCFVMPDVDDRSISEYPPFCSQAIARACVHGGGIDPVQMLSNRLTEPADLSRSVLWTRIGALEC